MISGGITGSGTKVMPFDPLFDNSLKAPKKQMGLFGRQISQVEKYLKELGAKAFSYTMGKCSKMVFSVYLVSLSFDKFRRLGSVRIDPIPPFSQIDPAARGFFQELFLTGVDLTQFRTVFAGGYIEIEYLGFSKVPVSGAAGSR